MSGKTFMIVCKGKIITRHVIIRFRASRQPSSPRCRNAWQSVKLLESPTSLSNQPNVSKLSSEKFRKSTWYVQLHVSLLGLRSEDALISSIISLFCELLHNCPTSSERTNKIIYFHDVYIFINFSHRKHQSYFISMLVIPHFSGFELYSKWFHDILH